MQRKIELTYRKTDDRSSQKHDENGIYSPTRKPKLKTYQHRLSAIRSAPGIVLVSILIVAAIQLAAVQSNFLTPVWKDFSESIPSPLHHRLSLKDCWSLRLQGVVRDQVEWIRKNTTTFPDSLFASFIRKRQLEEGVCRHELSWVSNDGPCAPEPFDPHSFLQSWSGRTLVMAGDSLSKMLYLDLTESLITAGLNVTIQSTFQPIDLLLNLLFVCRPFQKDCILCFFWGPGSIWNEINGNGDALAPLDTNNKDSRHASIFKGNLGPGDVILWNSGVHEKSDESSLRKLHWRVNQIVKSYALNGQNQAQLWWRETLPQHFSSGSYKHAEPQCSPAESWHHQVDSLGVYNDVTSPIVEAAGVPVMHTFASALPLHDAHYKPGFDCTHFCDGPWGPNNLHKAILTNMVRDAVEAGALPEPTGRHQTLQERWDALVEHPTTSALARLEICAHKGFQWDTETKGELPPALAACLCSSIRKNHTKSVRREVIEHLELEQRCHGMAD